MESFSVDLAGLAEQVSAAESKLAGVNHTLSEYHEKLSAYETKLREEYGYDTLIANRDNLQAALDDRMFEFNTARIRLMIDAMLRLVRADPDNAETAVKALNDAYPVQVYWNSNVSSELFVKCFKAYAKEMFEDSYWREYKKTMNKRFQPGFWNPAQESEYSWAPRIGIELNQDFLDNQLDEFLVDLDARTKAAAARWAKNFAVEYSPDDLKRRALFEVLRQEFEKS